MLAVAMALAARQALLILDSVAVAALVARRVAMVALAGLVSSL